MSDFATVKNDLDLYIKFIPYGIGSLTQILGDIPITNEYSPATEAYDFTCYGERWTSSQLHPLNGLVKAITLHRSRHQKRIPTQRHGKSPMLDNLGTPLEPESLTVDAMHVRTDLMEL